MAQDTKPKQIVPTAVAGKLPKQPASLFYWSDNLRDMALRSCSLTARGLWWDLLALMHDGAPYGHLASREGRPLTDEQVARMVGATIQEYCGLLGELEAAGVPSRTDDGVLYCRRMVRDEARRQIKAESGRLGGATTQARIKQKVAQAGAKAGALAPLETESETETESVIGMEGGAGGTNGRGSRSTRARRAASRWLGREQP